MKISEVMKFEAHPFEPATFERLGIPSWLYDRAVAAIGKADVEITPSEVRRFMHASGREVVVGSGLGADGEAYDWSACIEEKP